MKNLLIVIFVVLITTSCNQKKNQIEDNGTSLATTDSLAPNLVTLNGIPFDTADKMVKAFQKNPISSDPKTNVWFGKKYINEICTILDTGGGDGIRIYFARKDDGRNTIIIVSTKENGTINSPSKKRHKDYFEHSAPFLSTNEARNTEDYGTDTGARLYNAAPACPPENCPGSYNRIACNDAYKWVKRFSNGVADKFKTKGVWFSKDLLDRLRTELDASPNGDGIRIYFVIKPSGKHNLVIVTTKPSKTGHEDYFECYQSFVGVDDNGEECPISCDDATWQ